MANNESLKRAKKEKDDEFYTEYSDIEKEMNAYIEPHRVIINNTLYLLFNNSEFAYIGNLTNKIKLSELKNYIK